MFLAWYVSSEWKVLLLITGEIRLRNSRSAKTRRGSGFGQIGAKTKDYQFAG